MSPRPSRRPAPPRLPQLGLFGVLVVALTVSCASPRLKRRAPEAALAPNPTLLGPCPTAEAPPAATDPAKIPAGSTAPVPARPGEPPPSAPAKDRIQQAHWNKSLYLPDLLTPGAPNLVLLGAASCLSCKVVEAGLPAAVARSPHLRIMSIELSPTEPTAKALREAFEADELPVAVLFGPTGEPRRVVHGASEIQYLLANEAWEAPIPLIRPEAPAAPVAPPDAHAPPTEPADPAEGQETRPGRRSPDRRGTRPREEQQQQAVDDPIIRPQTSGGGQDLIKKPPEPPIKSPDEGPYIGPAPEDDARSAPTEQTEAAPRK